MDSHAESAGIAEKGEVGARQQERRRDSPPRRRDKEIFITERTQRKTVCSIPETGIEQTVSEIMQEESEDVRGGCNF
jgi:hypothetical protein